MRPTRLLGATAVASCALLLLTGTASAVPPANGVQEVLAAAGSSITYGVTGAILAAAEQADWNTDPDQHMNVPSSLAAGHSYAIPADWFGDSRTYDSANPPPGNSVQGKAALVESSSNAGALDIARSTQARTSADWNGLEFTAFATDAVTWASSASGASAGVSLTRAVLRGIYDGTLTNWSQVGGANAPIVAYLPPIGSDTQLTFVNVILGFDPATKPVTIKRFPENDATSIPAADRAGAIVPFSIASWIGQGNGLSPDKRAGFVLNRLTGAGSDGSPVTGSPGGYTAAYARTFLGAHLVFHVLAVNSASYDQAIRAVSYDDGDTASPLCGGKLAHTIRQYGFQPVAGENDLTCAKF